MNKSKGTFTNILMTISLVLLLISSAVVITLNFRQLYYYDITALDIPSYSGYSESEIRENYDALIDYNSIFYRDELDFPTLPMSKNGKIHFEEVKIIFVAVEIIFILSMITSALGLVLKIRKKQIKHLKYAAISSVLLPVIIGLFIAVSFDKFFVLFHKLFFNNDYWIFSAETDPIITMLPSDFFMHCAIMILAIILLGAVIYLLTYILLKRRFESKNTNI